MMAKFFLGLAIIAFTSFCGYILAKKYRIRKLFFAQFVEFNDRFLNEIAYYRRPLTEFLLKYSYKGAFGLLIEKLVENLDDAPIVLEEILTCNEFSFLTRDEKAETTEYFLNLGRGDSSSQKNCFSSYKPRLQNKQSETEIACKKYGDLYVKLGFLCGLLILILII